MGATSTGYGALRASHGHTTPFEIKFVEIENEDYIPTYLYQLAILHTTLK